MWSRKSSYFNYRSLFLLVRVRSGSFRLTLPLALFLIDETLEIAADLLWLVEKLVPLKMGYYNSGSKLKNQKFSKLMGLGFSSHEILGLCRQLFIELRRHGRYSLVEVESGTGPHKQRVSVEFL